MDLVEVTDLVPATGVRWQDGDAFLAGGTWLFSEPQPAVRRLLDLHAFGWTPLVRHEHGVDIAATCTLAELARWPDAPTLFAECCEALLGSFKIWNTATVGGNVCLALPAGPMTSLTGSLDGVAILLAPDGSSREVAIVDFVLGVRQTALRPGELLRAIRIPEHALEARTAFRQLSLTRYGRSAVVVIGRIDADGTTVLTVTAATPAPVQLRFAAVPAADDAVEAVLAAVPVWHDDVHGDPDWRAALTVRLVREVCVELGGA